jgi:hypothetical protein
MTNSQFKVYIYSIYRMINLDIKYINEGLIEDNKTIYFTLTNEGYLDYTKKYVKITKCF